MYVYLFKKAIDNSTSTTFPAFLNYNLRCRKLPIECFSLLQQQDKKEKQHLSSSKLRVVKRIEATSLSEIYQGVKKRLW